MSNRPQQREISASEPSLPKIMSDFIRSTGFVMTAQRRLESGGWDIYKRGVWVAGCSSSHEQYALAALRSGFNVQVAIETHELPDFQKGAKRAEGASPLWTQCGHCRRWWDDSLITATTPTPSGRCPFEYDHEYTD